MEFITSGWFPVPSRGGSASRSGRRAVELIVAGHSYASSGVKGSGTARLPRAPRARAFPGERTRWCSSRTPALPRDVATTGAPRARRGRRRRRPRRRRRRRLAAGDRRVGEGAARRRGRRGEGVLAGVPAAPGRAGLARLGVGWSPTPAKPRAGLIGGVASMEGGRLVWTERGGGGRGAGVSGRQTASEANAREAFETHGGVFRAEPEVIAREFPPRVAGGGASPAVSTSSISRARGCEARGRRGRGFQNIQRRRPKRKPK